jgi:hypothetical protein
LWLAQHLSNIIMHVPMVPSKTTTKKPAIDFLFLCLVGFYKLIHSRPVLPVVPTKVISPSNPTKNFRGGWWLLCGGVNY